MKISFWTVVLGLLVILPPAKADRGAVTEVREVDQIDLEDGPYKRIWQPHLAKWGKNTFVCCYGLELRGKYDMGDIACSITNDGGKTWSPRTMVFDHRLRNGTVQYAYNNPVLFRPPGQDVIWLYCMRVPIHYRNSENADLVAAYSGDGGLSWTHVELAMDYQGPLIIVGGIEVVERGGQTLYLLPAHRNTRRHDRHGDRRQFVLESTSLVKWKMAEYIDYPEESPVFLHEGKIAPSDEGEGLKIVMRTARMEKERPLDEPLAWSSVSLDGGKSWSQAKPEPSLPNFRAKSFFAQDSNGTHLYIYSDNFERHQLLFKTRPAGGEWSGESLFYGHENRNSYPTLVEDSPGRWFSVWDSSNQSDRTRTVIRSGWFEVK